MTVNTFSRTEANVFVYSSLKKLVICFFDPVTTIISVKQTKGVKTKIETYPAAELTVLYLNLFLYVHLLPIVKLLSCRTT